MDDQSNARSSAPEPAAIDRAEILKRAGLMLLGGASLAGGVDGPALAAPKSKTTMHQRSIVDHPPIGFSVFPGGRTIKAKDAGPTLPAAIGDYIDAAYFAFVLKKIDDADSTRRGVPNDTDFQKLNLNIPASATLKAAYYIGQHNQPAISGSDESAYIQHFSFVNGKTGDPLVGDGPHKMEYYDVFLLIFT